MDSEQQSPTVANRSPSGERESTSVANRSTPTKARRPLSEERLKVLAAARLKAAEVRKARSKERQDAKAIHAQEQAQLAELQRMEKAAKMLEVQRRTEELQRIIHAGPPSPTGTPQKTVERHKPEQVAPRRRQPSPVDVSRRQSTPVAYRSPTGPLVVTPPVPNQARRDIQGAHDHLYAMLFGGP